MYASVGPWQMSALNQLQLINAVPVHMVSHTTVMAIAHTPLVPHIQ